MINDRYELERIPLGRGGMGQVWAGRDTSLDREVAVKFIRFPEGAADKELVDRFMRESRITASLQHPGVPAIFDVGTHEDRPYLVMQRIHGVSVHDLVAEHELLPLGWAAAIAAQTCSVLTAAHGAKLVHRDLKPDNLMLEPDGGIKVLDFGLAVALDWADVSQITRTGQTIGTPAYMAPEQIQSARSSLRSDLYSLGCVLHEMLTGRQAFTGSTAFAVMQKQVGEDPLPIRRLRADVPEGLDRLLTAMLAKDPEDRPGSAQEVFDELLPFAENLGMLAGTLSSPSVPSPVRMYASALSRVLRPPEAPAPAPGAATPPSAQPSGTGNAPETPVAPQRPGPQSHPSGSSNMTRGEIERERARAGSHARQARYSQAAEVLGAVVSSAGSAFGNTDGEVVSLRLEWANVLYEGGEYDRAAPLYRALVTDLTERDGPDSELVFRCRLQDANCRALLGNPDEALQAMDNLLDDEHRVFGPEDLRPLELRRQIGLLQNDSGRPGQAAETLRELLADLLRAHGPDHPMVTKVRGDLDKLGDQGR